MNKPKQKENIAAYFKQFPNLHPSAEEVYMYVKQKDEKIGIATVYRHLNKMVEDGIIGELKLDKQGVRYDLLEHEHCHFVCDECRSIENFEIPLLKQANDEIETITNGKVRNKNMVVHGICKHCMKKH